MDIKLYCSGTVNLAGKMHEKPLYDGPRSALPKGPHVVI